MADIESVDIELAEEMSDEETDALVDQLEAFLQGDGNAALMEENAAILGGTYCVRCASGAGRRHTVRARNALSLFAKAVSHCGKAFQITRGPCR